MSAPNVGQPFTPPGQIVRDAAGRTYMANQQGQLVPVTVTQAPSAGDPSQQQVPNQPGGWNGPAGQPSQQPSWNQPPAQPVWNQPPVQQPNGAQVTDDTVMRGPGVPPELQGRTMGQIKQIYAAMRDRALSAGQPQQPQPQAQPQQLQQPNGQQPNSQPMDARTFYLNPEGNTRRIVEETLRATLEPMLAPIRQGTVQTAVANARDQFLASNPSAMQYMADMTPMLDRMPPEQLANPQTWDSIYNIVLGQKVRASEAQRLAPGYNPNPAPQQQFNAPVRSDMNGTFFTESPTPRPQEMQVPVAANLNPWQMNIARQSGITAEQYAQAAQDLAQGRMPVFGMPVGGQNGR